MPKVMLSPSDQYANIYAYGDTNEGVVCQRICERVKEILLTDYFDFHVEIESNMYEAVKRTNEWTPDLHLAVHTNACPEHTARGCRVFYYSTSSCGKVYAESLCKYFRSAYDVTGNKDIVHIAKPYDTLYELKATLPVALYLEIDFHDNPNGAKWILDHEELIAQEIAIFLVDRLSNYLYCPHCRERIFFK